MATGEDGSQITCEIDALFKNKLKKKKNSQLMLITISTFRNIFIPETNC
jgi:hypothetical protein